MYPVDKRGSELREDDPVTMIGRVMSLHTEDGKGSVTVQIQGPPGCRQPVVTVESKMLAKDE